MKHGGTPAYDLPVMDLHNQDAQFQHADATWMLSMLRKSLVGSRQDSIAFEPYLVLQRDTRFHFQATDQVCLC